jgi:hypothetical protein
VDETVETLTEMTQPVIIDLGKQKSRDLKDLKKGEGKLWDEVLDVVEEVKDMLGEEADGKVLVPIVMLYQQKPKRQRLNKALFPFIR